MAPVLSVDRCSLALAYAARVLGQRRKLTDLIVSTTHALHF
jgi:hypothetical protein